MGFIHQRYLLERVQEHPGELRPVQPPRRPLLVPSIRQDLHRHLLTQRDVVRLEVHDHLKTLLLSKRVPSVREWMTIFDFDRESLLK